MSWQAYPLHRTEGETRERAWPPAGRSGSGSSTLFAGLEVTPKVTWSFSRGCRCRACPIPVGQIGWPTCQS